MTRFYKDPIFFFYTFLFGLTAVFALNTGYVEGDDAATVLYHLFGRNHELQPAYAPYHSGLDWVLQFLPPHENLLRNTAAWLSFLSAWLGLYILRVFCTRLLDIPRSEGLIFFAVLPFVIPDFFFNSLIINSTNISFVLALWALSSFWKYWAVRPAAVFLAVFTFTFAAAVTFRWSMLMILPVFAGLAIWQHTRGPDPRGVPLRSLVWSVLAVMGSLLLAVLLISMTGYGPLEVPRILLRSRNYLPIDQRYFAMLATASPFLTPSLIFLLAASVVFCLARFRRSSARHLGRLSFFLCSLSPFLFIRYYPWFKFNIFLLPVLIVFIYPFFSWLLKKRGPLLVFLFLTFVPWILGIQIDAKGTFYGPGFEIGNLRHESKVLADEKNLDDRVKPQSFRVTLRAGFYMSTPDGPRPLYGYGSALLGGEWKRQIDARYHERQAIFEIMQRDKTGIIYMQDRPTALFQCDLFRWGYQSEMPFTDVEGVPTRYFKKGSDVVTVRYIPETLDRMEWLRGYAASRPERILFHSAYSSLVQRLLQISSGFELLGPYAALSQGADASGAGRQSLAEPGL